MLLWNLYTYISMYFVEKHTIKMSINQLIQPIYFYNGDQWVHSLGLNQSPEE